MENKYQYQITFHIKIVIKFCYYPILQLEDGVITP